MKNIKTTVALAGLVTMGAVALSQPAFAEVKTTEATLKVTAGDLSFTAPTVMAFDPLRVNPNPQSTEKNTGDVVVSDYRTSAVNGWTMTVKAEGTLLTKGVQIVMDPASLTNTEKVTPGQESMKVTGAANTIMKISNASIAGSDFITTFKPNTYLSLPGGLEKGDYAATITWDLHEGPTV